MERTALLPIALTGFVLLSGLVVVGPVAATAASPRPVSSAATSVPAGGPDRAEVIPDRVEIAPDAAPTLIEPEADATSRQAALALDADFVDVDIPARADIRTHQVTIALVAPQGSTPGGFTTADAARSLALVDDFYARETGDTIRFELEQVIDWQVVDEPIACTDTGGLHDWVSRRTGWQPAPARHLVVMVPFGDPCPGWANGAQPSDPDEGGRSFQPGPDAYYLVHELGHNLSLPHAFSVQCAMSWDYPSTPLPPGCSREEYGNLTEIMGGAGALPPLSAPSLARLGTLANTRQPVCGTPRTGVLDALGAGPGAARALTWTDPQDASIRYWVQYNDADAVVGAGLLAGGLSRSGVQVFRSNPDQPYGGDLLERPGDASDANEFLLAGETAALNTGMAVRVDAIDDSADKATVTVTVPCTEYVGDISGLATTTASYTSPWTTTAAAIDGSTSTAWGTWPTVGEQWLELAWPVEATIDSATVRFASDTLDSQNSGLIPPRTWRVEHLDAATGTWAAVTDASTPGRVRDAANTVTFRPVTTSRLRIVFTAWGAGEYGGSTAVAEVGVNGVAAAASLVVRGSAQPIPTGTTRDLQQGVTVVDRKGAQLPGRTVDFLLTGPASFAGGAKSVSVLSNGAGFAALPSVTAGTTTGALAVTAQTTGLAPVALPSATVVAAASVTATASTRLVSGKVVLSVTAKNTGARPADITVTTAYGTAKYPAVAPGASVTKAFSTQRTSIAAGTARVTAVSGTQSATVSAAYAAR
ncbi:discoidin domain-containing protein [Rathayibacter sp. Leaf248]|uniref:discoidin domain-containing protein n=1 Tax=Rathayibacter sp. Leaf248 TaxID=2876555 RepID=UPI001E385FB2|nr:discoidin domain-containing protein [Rathayibacter sp. Leaf248]